MTPKEKANELFQTFTLKPISPIFIMSDEHIKTCALNCVDEIMHDILFHLTYDYRKRLEFWQNVKTEINNL